jgi:hypothetical protein
MAKIIDPSMWLHNCKESGWTGTKKGEPCNWCDVTEEEIEEDALRERHDILMEPK